MGNRKILVVDDDADVRLGMEVRLKANHYDTFFASDAVSTLREARKHEPDLIILDLGLPNGDGFVVIEKLKVWPSLAMIPIIVVSALDVRANKERAIKAGAKAYLQKPVDNEELLRVIRQALGEPHSRIAMTRRPNVCDEGLVKFFAREVEQRSAQQREHCDAQ
jgi:DNA-binding response OmpR family regulator